MNLTPAQRRVLEAVDAANRGSIGAVWEDANEGRTMGSLERSGLVAWTSKLRGGAPAGYWLTDAGKAELEKPAPTPAAAKQRASRATRKAAGAKMVSIMLTPEAAVALDRLQSQFGFGAAELISAALVRVDSVEAYRLSSDERQS